MQAAPVTVVVSRVVDPVQAVAGADVGWSRSWPQQHHHWILLLGWRCGGESGRFCLRQLRRVLYDWQRGQVVTPAVQRVGVRHRRDVTCQRCSKVSATAALTVSMVCFRHDETLPLASTGAGRSGTSVTDGDTANDSQIIDPAAAATLLDANTCIACMARTSAPFVAAM